ncbi:MAG: hypothetical protein PsegKO_36230 [Pseudohongiellaceae bacterium]
MRENLEIAAVSDSHLRPILDRFDMSSKIDSHQATCENCGQYLSWDDIGALVTRHGSVAIYCDKPDCLEVISNNQQ